MLKHKCESKRWWKCWNAKYIEWMIIGLLEVNIGLLVVRDIKNLMFFFVVSSTLLFFQGNAFNTFNNLKILQASFRYMFSKILNSHALHNFVMWNTHTTGASHELCKIQTCLSKGIVCAWEKWILHWPNIQDIFFNKSLDN
jgi:hypothetical protein